MEDITMAGPEELLATRRSRRSTAGNRMEAALAEMALDIVVESVEDDVDFVNDKDEEDVFGSDFESTDEEADREAEEAGDKDVQEEERRARKEARSRVEKATAAAHAKHKVTFNPQAQIVASTSKLKESKRRVSLGVAVNAETGEVLPVGKSSPRKKRHSLRKHTILNTSATVKRMKYSEEKKAATPKKAKIESKTYTQAELIARALDNEEGNIVQHRDYLKIEEEKRKRARLVRATVEGPLIRWISKGEEIKVIVPPPPAPSFPPRTPYVYGSYNTAGSTAYGQGVPYMYQTGAPSQVPAGVYTSYTPPAYTPQASTSTSTPTPVSFAPPSSATQASPTPPAQYQPTSYNPYLSQLQANAAMWTPPPPPQPTERIEKVAKDYVVHEVAQHEGVGKAPWHETMAAMFGDHVKWDELKVYVGKGRPLSRPKQLCPITGKQAKYLDPRTGVPYADVRAYEVLTGILRHEFIWSSALGCYVGKEERAREADVMVHAR